MIFVFSTRLCQGHKRAPSDASVASSEDEKIPLSPSILESVPEKVELVVPTPTPNELPVANHVVDTSFVEEPTAAAVVEPTEETPSLLVEDGEVEQKSVEETLPEAMDVTSPEPEAAPETPAKEMEQLEIANKEDKKVDTADVPASPKATTESSEVMEAPQEDKMDIVEETNVVTEEEDLYKHLKVTLTLPGEDKPIQKEEGEKEREEDKTTTEEDKVVPDKAKEDKERDSDSGRGSAADNSSIDLNLSISSFLSKTKEPGSVTLQVRLHNALLMQEYVHKTLHCSS